MDSSLVPSKRKQGGCGNKKFLATVALVVVGRVAGVAGAVLWLL